MGLSKRRRDQVTKKVPEPPRAAQNAGDEEETRGHHPMGCQPGPTFMASDGPKRWMRLPATKAKEKPDPKATNPEPKDLPTPGSTYTHNVLSTEQQKHLEQKG